MQRNTVAHIIDGLQREGRYTFTKAEIGSTLGLSEAALKLSLLRLSKKGRISHVRRGFYVVVPVEYASRGCLPADWFIDDLMRHMGEPHYYVGLLSAAALHGAAHQQPQDFQVIIGRTERDIEYERLRIRLFAKADLEGTPVTKTKTSTGFMRVSTPEATALDLVRYAGGVGGLQRVLTVLQELHEALTSDALLGAVATQRHTAPVQRLGWLLDSLDRADLTTELAQWVAKRAPREAPLIPSLNSRGCPRDRRWNVTVNAELEGDL